MEESPCLEKYPLGTVVISNVLNYSIWIIGFYVLSGFGILVSLLFLAYCLFLEFRVLTKSCVNCYYYGKRCFSGKGMICSALFKKGESYGFINRRITWKDILPDFFVSIIPIVGGFVLLLTTFSWLVLILIVVILLLTTAGNSVVRGKLACRYCRQREIGCPALKLFEKTNG